MPGRKDVLYYDGACGMCRGWARVLQRLDWLGRLEFRDMCAAEPSELPVDWAAAMRGLPMRTRDGRVLVGYDAVRRGMIQSPVGALPAAVLYVPGISWVGRRVYGWVAARRPRSACSVSPDRGHPTG